MNYPNRLVVCSAFLLVIPISLVCGESIGGFRGYDWGSSRDAVIEGEGEPDYTEDRGLTYHNVSVGPHKAEAFFGFDGNYFGFDSKNELQVGVYDFTGNARSGRRSLENYKDLNQRLQRIYGRIHTDEELWIGDRGFLQRANGDAIERGDVALLTGWTDAQGRVLHIIRKSPSGYSVQHFILYWGSSGASLWEIVQKHKSGGL